MHILLKMCVKGLCVCYTGLFCSWPSSSAQGTTVILYFALFPGPKEFSFRTTCRESPILIHAHPSLATAGQKESQGRQTGQPAPKPFKAPG